MTSKMIVTVFKDLPPDSDRLYDGSLSVQLFNSIILSDYLQLTYDRDAAPRAPEKDRKCSQTRNGISHAVVVNFDTYVKKLWPHGAFFVACG